jgi:hypothetical protein
MQHTETHIHIIKTCNYTHPHKSGLKAHSINDRNWIFLNNFIILQYYILRIAETVPHNFLYNIFPSFFWFSLQNKTKYDNYEYIKPKYLQNTLKEHKHA